MPIAIIIRQEPSVNLFRDLLIGSISTGAGNEALICSGFFQEARGTKPNPYRASCEPGFAHALTSHGVALTTVGIHNRSWMTSYQEFKRGMQSKKVIVNAKCIARTHANPWHAKIFILQNKAEPVYGIIGSSNITRNAFSTSSPFNYECDVVLWSPKSKKMCQWMNSIIDNVEYAPQVIKAPYSVVKNGGITIEERLKKLKDLVLSQNLIDI